MFAIIHHAVSIQLTQSVSAVSPCPTQVKQIMEEAVTRKFVHEDSSHIVSFCGKSKNIEPFSWNSLVERFLILSFKWHLHTHVFWCSKALQPELLKVCFFILQTALSTLPNYLVQTFSFRNNFHPLPFAFSSTASEYKGVNNTQKISSEISFESSKNHIPSYVYVIEKKKKKRVNHRDNQKTVLSESINWLLVT